VNNTTKQIKAIGYLNLISPPVLKTRATKQLGINTSFPQAWRLNILFPCRENYDNLKFLFEFLKLVASQEEKNKMSRLLTSTVYRHSAKVMHPKALNLLCSKFESANAFTVLLVLTSKRCCWS
jgi:hypothetical protein